MNQARTLARVDFRTTTEVKSLIERAAIISGMTLTEFIKSVVVEKSREVIAHNEVRVLSDRDRDAFLDMLDRPAAPNAKLLAGAAVYKKAVKDGTFIP